MRETTGTLKFLRHGRSCGNDDKVIFQGRGDTCADGSPNGLVEQGRRQTRAAGYALGGAGVELTVASSSSMLRAKQSIGEFVYGYEDPSLSPIFDLPNLEEASHAGWELIHTRDEVKLLLAAKVETTREQLRQYGMKPDHDQHLEWVVQRGEKGEMPLEVALRYLRTIQAYGIYDREIIVAHGMAIRFATEAGSRLTTDTREELEHLLTLGTVGKIAVLDVLKKTHAPPFAIANHTSNKLENGEMLECTVLEDGRWIPIRRIAPMLPPKDVTLSATTVGRLEQRRVDNSWEVKRYIPAAA